MTHEARAGKIENRHVGDAGRSDDGRVVAVWAGEKRLHLSIDHRMTERGVYSAE